MNLLGYGAIYIAMYFTNGGISDMKKMFRA